MLSHNFKSITTINSIIERLTHSELPADEFENTAASGWVIGDLISIPKEYRTLRREDGNSRCKLKLYLRALNVILNEEGTSERLILCQLLEYNLINLLKIINNN